MGTIELDVPDEVEAEFRRLARRQFGGERGSISRAGGEALKLWTVHNEAASVDAAAVDSESPADILDGVIADSAMADRVDSGVDLGNEIGRQWASKYEGGRSECEDAAE